MKIEKGIFSLLKIFNEIKTDAELTIVGRKDLPTSTSVIDKIEEKEDDSLPKIPKNEN